MLASMLLSNCVGLAASLTPLTEIQPATVELDAFAATLQGALAKLGRPADSVVHVIGASSVEDAVEWAPTCRSGTKLVLVGPKANARDARADDCVTVVPGLYSRNAVRAALGDVPVADPDLIVLHNSDLYMPYWRRTLAELLQLGKPVVLTMYCEFELAKMERLLKWAEIEFSADAFAECDRLVSANFEDDMATGHSEAGAGAVPEPRVIWGGEPNPHAHAPPRNCYGGMEHGVRNSYWMAFTGAAEKNPSKDEL